MTPQGSFHRSKRDTWVTRGRWRSDAHGRHDVPRLGIGEGAVLAGERVAGGRGDVDGGAVEHVPGDVLIHGKDEVVIVGVEGEQGPHSVLIGTGQVDVADPEPGFGAGGPIAAQQAGQRQELRIVEEPDVGGQVVVAHGVGDLADVLVVDVQLVGREGAVGALEQVVNLLGDVEEPGFGGVDHDALGLNAKGIEEGDQGLEDLGHTAAGGGAVEMEHTQMAELVCQREQFAGLLGVHVGQVVVERNSRIVDLEIHLISP